jgi:zinc/manganese transport system substrate-binding protein
MKRAFMAGLALLALWKPGQAATDIVASIPELGAIAREVGGNKVRVDVIAPPNNDYHRVEPRPSLVQRVRRADLVVRVGLGLDNWMDTLMNAAGNAKLNRGGNGYVDASAEIPVVDKPNSSITGASGDVHPNGNPHYFYDPVYAKFVGRNIVRGLIRVDEKNADYYRGQLADFYKQIDRRMEGWKKELAPFNGKSLVTYHENLQYFVRRFGLRIYDTLEPKPGIPPSGAHINRLMNGMKTDGIKAVLVESIYSTKYPELIKRQLGVDYVVAPYSVGSMGTRNYFDFMDLLVDKAKQALR